MIKRVLVAVLWTFTVLNLTLDAWFLSHMDGNPEQALQSQLAERVDRINELERQLADERAKAGPEAALERQRLPVAVGDAKATVGAGPWAGSDAWPLCKDLDLVKLGGKPVACRKLTYHGVVIAEHYHGSSRHHLDVDGVPHQSE